MGNKDIIEKKHNALHAAPPGSTENTSTVQQLAFTAAGAAGAALLGAILARQGHAPKTVSGALAALGAGLAGIGDSDALRAFGAGAMSGSGAQLVLMLLSEYEDRKSLASDAPASVAAPGDHAPAPSDAANGNVVPLAAKAAAS
jgi:hypothetical protein